MEYLLTPLITLPIPGKSITISFWDIFGLSAQLLFTARVLTQWAASEREKKTVVPVSFWWLSFFGAIVQVIYSGGIQNTIFLLNSLVPVVPYIRNLIIYYRPNRQPRNMMWLIVVAIGLGLIPEWIFWRKNGSVLHDVWFYWGLAATAVFSSRFFIQWIQSERKRRNVMSAEFWYASLFGSLMMLVYSFAQGNFVFIVGFIFNGVPMLRNLTLIRRNRLARKAKATQAAELSGPPR